MQGIDSSQTLKALAVGSWQLAKYKKNAFMQAKLDFSLFILPSNFSR